MRQRNVSGLFEDAYLGRRGADVREILPDVRRLRQPRGREPRALGDGDHAPGFEEPPPLGEPPLEADVVDRPLGPDEVQLFVAEGQFVHRPDEGRDLFAQPRALHPCAKLLDHSGQQVHGRDRAVKVPGEHFGLPPRTAADVGDAESGTSRREEPQSPDGLFVAAGALPVEGAEKIGDEGQIEFEDRFFVFVVHNRGYSVPQDSSSRRNRQIRPHENAGPSYKARRFR